MTEDIKCIKVLTARLISAPPAIRLFFSQTEYDSAGTRTVRSKSNESSRYP